VIEDMILNGSLRNLEVVLRENFVARFRKGAGQEDKNWIALKQICKDPYLEGVSLLTRCEGWYDLSSEWRRKGEKDVTFMLND
jgi:hypothetical protein